MTTRALAGDAHSRSADTAFDTGKWKEAHFLHKLHESSGNFDLVMNWSVIRSHVSMSLFFCAGITPSKYGKFSYNRAQLMET